MVLKQMILISLDSQKINGNTTKASLTMETKEAMVRLLDATNLLKYAREGGGDNFFDSLSQDLELVLTALSQVEEP